MRELHVSESVNSERLRKTLAAIRRFRDFPNLERLKLWLDFHAPAIGKNRTTATLVLCPPAHQPFKRATLILFRQGYGPVDLKCAGYGGHVGIGLTSSDTDFILTCGDDRIPRIGHHAEIAWL